MLLHINTEMNSSDSFTLVDNSVIVFFKNLDHSVIGGIFAIFLGICACSCLPCFGFGSGGVAAGSYAAATQSSIGNVAGGSFFACF